MTHPRVRLPDPEPEWAALPTSRSPRWFFPRRAGGVTKRSFLIHHPVTLRSRAGWEAARLLAARGGLRLLPPSAMLPREVWDPLAGLIPKSGVLAVARANHPGRFFALVVGAQEELLAFAKIARDSNGAEALQRERHALETLGTLLRPPLSAPRVLEAEDGVLILTPIEWRARRKPWRLPLDVAHALGRFFRASASKPEASLGATHGDCAPWNLLRTRHGWALVDWESAQENVPAFFDPFHFLVQSSVDLRRPGKRAIIDGLALNGWVGASIEAYAAGAEVDPREARVLFADYIRYSTEHVAPGAPPRAIRIRQKLSDHFTSSGVRGRDHSADTRSGDA